MKSIVLFLLLVVLSVPTAFAQIKIGDNPQNIDGASVLELESSDRVLVITRVNTAEMEAIVPQRGGLVYNTDTNCVSYYDGTEWINLCDAAGITFTNEHLENTSLGPSILITQNGNSYNFEVAPNSIRSEQIVDGGINGVDIQDNSIGESKLGADSVSANELRDNSVGSSEVVDGSIRPEDLANTGPEQVLTTDENGIPGWEDASSLTDGVALDIAENTADIADHILNDNDTDDRNELTDISFDKITNILSLTRSETAVGQTTDLSSLVGSDDQTLTLTADNRLQIEDGNEIDLSILNNSGSDNQTLSLTGNTLAITGGNNVSLAGYVNTDNQAISIVGNTISLTNGGSINLPPGTVDTDDQQLSIAGNRISLTDGGFVDLPPGTINTDNQDLSRTGNTINITGGTGVDLTPILGSGADGVVSQVALAGTDLNFTGAGGGFNGTVSLAGLGGGTADGALTNVVLNGTDLEFTSSAGGFTGPVSLAGLGGGGADGVITNMQLTGTDLVVTGTAPGFSGTIPLAALAGTDNQQLTLEPGNLLTLVDGGPAINLTPFLDNQTVTDFSFDDTSNILSITLEDGNTETVDLTALAVAGADNQTATEVPFTPYVTLAGPNTQLAIQQLKDELDAATIAGGGENPTNELQDIQLAGTVVSLTIPATPGNQIDLGPTFVTEAELATAITTSEAIDNDTDDANEIQPLVSTDGSVTVAANGIGFDLSVPIGTDNQNIQGSVLNAETLTIGIQNGTAQDVDLSALTTDLELATAITASEATDNDTDDTNEIQPLISTDGSVTVAANGIGFDISVPVGTDSQNIQGSVLNDETLTIGIQNGTAQDVDLSALTTDLELAAAITASETADGDTSDTNEIQPLVSTDGSVVVAANGIGFDLSVPLGTDNQNIEGSVLNAETLTIGIEGGNPQDLSLAAFALDTDVTALIAASEAADNDTDDTNEIQPLVSTDGSVTVAANGIGFDLSVAGGGTDDQNLESAILTGTDLDINIEGGNDVTADLSTLTTDVELAAAITASEATDNDTDDTNEIQPLTSTDGSVTVAANGIGFDLSVAGGGTDDQNLESAILTGTDLDINIEGGNDVTADLSTLTTDVELAAAITASEATDNDTDDTNEIQTITSPDASVTVTPNGNNYELTVAGGGTDNQNLESAILTGTDLDINIEGGNNVTADLSALTTDVELAAAITASEATDNDTDDTNEIQPLVSTDGSVTVAANGIGFDLSVAGGGTDDQNLESAILTGTDLDINIEGGNDVTADLSTLTTDVELAAAITASEAADNDTDDTNEIELPTGGNNGEILTTDGSGNYSWTTNSGIMGTTGSIFFADGAGSPTENNNELFWDETNDRLGIGTNNPDRALEVVGEIKSTSFASAQGTALEPAYSFHTGTDTNTGMFRPAADEIGFSAGGEEALRIEEDGGITNVIVFESLELNNLLLDKDGDSGTAGQILSSTGGQTDWINAPSAGNDFSNSDLTFTGLRTHQMGNFNLILGGTGRIAMGTIGPAEKLHVDGNIRANGEFISATTTYPDYVFQKYFLGSSSLNTNYEFTTLEKIETFIKKYHHLPGIKSAAEVEKEGSWNLTDGAIKNLEKIEELFLHTIEQEKKIKSLTSENEALTKKLESLQNDVEAIKQQLSTKSVKE